MGKANGLFWVIYTKKSGLFYSVLVTELVGLTQSNFIAVTSTGNVNRQNTLKGSFSCTWRAAPADTLRHYSLACVAFSQS